MKRTSNEPNVEDAQNPKIEAIYELREAVELKVLAEQALEQSGTPEARDALLDAQLALEDKTQNAIESCLECGDVHHHGDPHASPERVSSRDGNVIRVDFSA